MATTADGRCWWRRDTGCVEVSVQPCAASDLAVLQQFAAVTGRSLMAKRWLDLQSVGDLTYLVAWSGNVPVGHVCVRWAGRPDGLVQRELPGVPELAALEVYPAELRRHGVGRRLIEAAQEHVRARSCTRLGMAVGTENAAAMELCTRLGFVDWGRGAYRSSWKDIDFSSRATVRADVVTYLVKDLAA